MARSGDALRRALTEGQSRLSPYAPVGVGDALEAGDAAALGLGVGGGAVGFGVGTGVGSGVGVGAGVGIGVGVAVGWGPCDTT